MSKEKSYSHNFLDNEFFEGSKGWLEQMWEQATYYEKLPDEFKNNCRSAVFEDGKGSMKIFTIHLETLKSCGGYKFDGRHRDIVMKSGAVFLYTLLYSKDAEQLREVK